MFTQELADILKERVGQKYRPSNGTEGDTFTEKFCDNCLKEDLDNDVYCPINNKTMLHDIEDAEYPSEWQYSPYGQPVCTAFERRQDVSHRANSLPERVLARVSGQKPHSNQPHQGNHPSSHN